MLERLDSNYTNTNFLYNVTYANQLTGKYVPIRNAYIDDTDPIVPKCIIMVTHLTQ
jgi:hypothetical protein